MARYALIIGITEYQSPQLSRLPKAATDAEIVAQLLEQYGDFQVKRLPESWTPDKKRKVGEKKVTGAELGQELKTLLLKQATGSEALIYFAGHGFTVSDNVGEQQGFLATSDCQIEMTGDVAVAQKYGISLESLNKLIAQSDLSSLVMLLDCCHSGYFLERNLIQQTLTAFSAQKDYYLITACRSYEQAKSFKGEPHAIFTGAVLKGLAAENAGSNRRVTGDRLFDYISGELKNSVQEPIRMGWGRSITLVTYPYQEQTTAEVTFNRENPYLGLHAFAPDKQKYFFGREQAVRALLDRLNNNRFLAVIGPSGCGKSSLVKAGLLPQLQCDRIVGSSQWDIESLTPGKHPLGTLIEILERRQRQDTPFVLFIDQFEEVFTLCDNPIERQSFVRLMAEQATACERVARVIATIRGDFLDRCAEYPEAVNLINHAQPTTYVVTPLSRRELEEAIEKPAALHGVKFEGGLVSQIADDVEHQPGALPLLQYALSELWRVFCLQDTPSSQPILTWKDYEQIGGVKGALDKRATLLYQSLNKNNQAFVRHLFMELVQVNEGQELTRRRATWDELEAIADSSDQLQQVVGLLADQQQRLIITDENTVEVAHEALLYEWKLLRGWIEENREHLWLRRCLEADCREWQQRYQQSDEALLVGARLAAITEWVEKTEIKLPPLEAEFLHKSLTRRDRQDQAKLEQERQLREEAEARAKAEAEKAEQEKARALAEIEKAMEAEARALAEARAEAARAREAEARAKVQKQRVQFVSTAGVLLAFTLGLGLLAQRSEIQKKQVKAIAVGSLTSKSQQLLERGAQLEALIASVQALDNLKKIDGGNSSELNNLKSTIFKVSERNRLSVHTESVESVTFDPKGRLIASAGFDGTIKLWYLQKEKLESIPGNYKAFFRVKFSPDGKTIATASIDGTIKLWNLNSNRRNPQLIQAHQASVYDISFNPNGKTIASSSEDGTLKLWNLVNRKQVGSIKEKGRIVSIDFSPDQKTIAFPSSEDFSIKLWNTVDNSTKIFKPQRGDRLSCVKFSPDGTILASSEYSGIIKIWNLKNFKLKETITTNHKAYLLNIAFSPDSNMLASTGEDGSIKIWNINENKPYLLENIEGHKNSIQEVTFNPKKNREIASASGDATVRIWEINSRNTEIKSQKTIDQLLDYSCETLKTYINLNKVLNNKNENLDKNLEETRNICYKNKK